MPLQWTTVEACGKGAVERAKTNIGLMIVGKEARKRMEWKRNLAEGEPFARSLVRCVARLMCRMQNGCTERNLSETNSGGGVSDIS